MRSCMSCLCAAQARGEESHRNKHYIHDRKIYLGMVAQACCPSCSGG